MRADHQRHHFEQRLLGALERIARALERATGDGMSAEDTAAIQDATAALSVSAVILGDAVTQSVPPALGDLVAQQPSTLSPEGE